MFNEMKEKEINRMRGKLRANLRGLHDEMV